ncbi:transposase [Nocardia sp. NPDC051981]|uniref:IS110 family transposase n=1 Tax=Nocardia sp. NPDC051981 TaxID=3155417 RepID=UPI00341C6096
MDPHKRSATIEIIDAADHILAVGRYTTDTVGYTEMLTTAQQFTDRVWAVEDCNGIGRHLAHRRVHDGETVVDVPAKLSAQVRVFATGNGRKTDPVDAHSVALAALHAPNPRRVPLDPELVALGLLADRHDELGRARTQTLNRIHRTLLDLIPGGIKKFLSAPQARDLITDLRPSDPVGRVQLRLVIELIEELETIDRKTKTADKELRQLVLDRGSTLMDLHGIGPSSAARLLADTGDIHRFATRDRFASWNGTAPLDASSGDSAARLRRCRRCGGSGAFRVRRCCRRRPDRGREAAGGVTDAGPTRSCRSFTPVPLVVSREPTSPCRELAMQCFRCLDQHHDTAVRVGRTDGVLGIAKDAAARSRSVGGGPHGTRSSAGTNPVVCRQGEPRPRDGLGELIFRCLRSPLRPTRVAADDDPTHHEPWSGGAVASGHSNPSRRATALPRHPVGRISP